MRVSRKILSVLCVLYIIFMLYFLFIRDREPAVGDYWQNLREHILLKPFGTIAQYTNSLISLSGTDLTVRKWYYIKNLLGNIVMFIPMGFFFPFFLKGCRTYGRTLLFCMLTVLMIEILQAVTLLGYFDIDDLILNLAGASFGYLIFRAYSFFTEKSFSY